ncbi:MAG: hypothetical protein ACXU9A_17940, partial [Xanthobacteraceae bacterium]
AGEDDLDAPDLGADPESEPKGRAAPKEEVVEDRANAQRDRKRQPAYPEDTTRARCIRCPARAAQYPNLLEEWCPKTFNQMSGRQ